VSANSEKNGSSARKPRKAQKSVRRANRDRTDSEDPREEMPITIGYGEYVVVVVLVVIRVVVRLRGEPIEFLRESIPVLVPIRLWWGRNSTPYVNRL
jgi:hypothetical protein